MKNNFNNQQQRSSNQNESNRVDSDQRMRAQNRDIINEGKNLSKLSQSRNQSSNNNSSNSNNQSSNNNNSSSNNQSSNNNNSSSSNQSSNNNNNNNSNNQSSNNYQ